MLTNLKSGTMSAVSEMFPLERWVTLAWTDIKLRYRRTKLGPFWMTLNTAVLIVSVGVVWGVIFHMPMKDYLPYFAIGMVTWNFVSATLTEGCLVFLSPQHIIKSMPVPLIIHVCRLIGRQIICLGHNLVFIALLWVVMARPLSYAAFAVIPALLILTLTLFGSVLTLGILCARFRDIPQLVNSVLQILFLITPIIWTPGRLPTETLLEKLLYLNPFYSLIEIVRGPVMGENPTAATWICATITMIAVLGIGLSLQGRFAKRVPYWL